MLNRPALVFAVLASLALAPATHASPAAMPTVPRPWTLDDILALKTVSDPQVSPDGRRVAYVVQELAAGGSEYPSDVWLADVATGVSHRLTTSPVVDEFPRWSPDGRTLAFLSDRPRDGAAANPDEGRRQIWTIDPDGGEAVPLTNAAGGVSSFAWSPKGDRIVFLSHEPKSAERRGREKVKDDAFTPAMNYAWNRLWTIEVASKRALQLTHGDFHVSSFDVSPDGQKIVVAAQPTPRIPDQFLSDLYLVPMTGGEPSVLVKQRGADDRPSFSPDGRSIAFVSQDGRTTEWWANNFICLVPVSGGRPVNLTATFDERIGGIGESAAPLWTPDGSSVLFTSIEHTTQRIFRAFTDARPVERVTNDAVVDAAPSIDAQDHTMAWLREDSEHPRDVWVWQASHPEPRRLTDVNPETRGRLSFRKSLITWPGADGRTIEGLLVAPSSPKPGVRAPLVLNVHGGPAGTHTMSFTPNRIYPWPLLVQQGYAVLMPNPRGSGGYGEAFRKSNVRDWGGKDYEDLMAGVDAVVRLGLVDSTRMAVCGWSYGGYMTSTIVTKTDRFRCAVVGAGVTNLSSMAGTCDIPDFNRSYFASWPWEDPQVYVDHSALFHAGNVHTPTLFVHGGADERVPTSQGWEFYSALHERGVPTDLLILPREPHGPREPQHQRSVLQWHMDWITRWTGAAANPRARTAAAGSGAGAATRTRGH